VIVAAPGTVDIMHCLVILGDLAGVHDSVPADSVLVAECFAEDCIWTHRIVPWECDLVVGVAVPACDTLNNSDGQRSRSFGLDEMVLEIVELG
jgi:hypothetical protein